MKYISRLVLLILLAANSYVGCAQNGNRQDTETKTIDSMAILESINQLRSDYISAVNAGDFDKLATLVTHDAVTVQPGSQSWKIMRALSKEAPFPPGARITIKPIETVVINDDWVYELGYSTLTYTKKGTRDSKRLRDTYLVLLKRTEQGWKVHREVSSAYIPKYIKQLQ